MGATERKQYFAERPILEHVGPADGRAAERARDELGALASMRGTLVQTP